MASSPPPDDAVLPSTGGVRRHHTISASSRTARAAKDAISEEVHEQALWNDDEPVDQDWVGGVGAVGEKSSLHRQSSLPTRYHRGFQNHASKTGSMTPKTVNSLAAIAGHEGDEEPWNIADYNVQEAEPSPPSPQAPPQHAQVIETQAQQQSAASPLSPHFAVPPPAPSPPAGNSGVRRHVSLTYGSAIGGPRKINQPLKRSGTLQATIPSHQAQEQKGDDQPNEEEEYSYEPGAYEAIDDTANYEDEYYLRQQQQLTQQQQQSQQQGAYSNMGRSSPWGTGSNDWRTNAFANQAPAGSNAAIDDVQRALSALELASNNNMYAPVGYGGYQQQQQMGQSIHPPRFNPSQPPPQQGQGSRNTNTNNNNGNGNGNGNGKLQLVTEFDGRKTPLGRGPTSTSNTYAQQQQYQQQPYGQQGPDRAQSWDQTQKPLGRTSNPNLQYAYQQGQHHKSASSGSNSGGNGGGGNGGAIPAVPPIPQQYLQQQQQQQQVQRPGLGVATSFASSSGGQQQQGGAPQPQASTGQTPTQGPYANTPIDVPTLIATKGYNPANFDIRPHNARFFVIKSYTEDDVHKSLKYEIWSSTDPGNKRLDKAFKETAGRGPIYLFFSVNASGHFCGMAEMLTPVDYTRSSTVWASDKWKGVFKVRWVFVRDIPNVNLRHIKLNNTQERKPVTNSRDTQELMPDAGQEMLRIFHTHPARTSLLQDFAFYELQAMQKMQGQQGQPQSGSTSPPHPSSSSSPAHLSPQMQPAHPQQQQQAPQNLFANPNALAYQMPQMTPMMQMQMQMQMGMGGGGGVGAGQGQFGGLGHSQAMHQSVMRHPSPGPSPPPHPQQQHVGGGQGGFMGMPTF